MKRASQLQQQLQIMIEKSEESLSAAKELYQSKHYDDAVSRIYYAVFHALQAILLTKNLSFSKHSAVLSYFNKEFVHSKIFPKNFYDKVMRLFQHRQIGDYDYEVSIDQDECSRDLEDAKVIIEAIVAFLKKEKHFDS